MENYSRNLLNQAVELINKASMSIGKDFLVNIFKDSTEDYAGEYLDLIKEQIGWAGYDLSEQLINWDADFDEWETEYFIAREKAAKRASEEQTHYVESL